MTNYTISHEKHPHFSIADENSRESLSKLGKALSSVDRIRILELITEKPVNLQEISRKLNIPLSTVSSHVDVLSEARLIITSYYPGLKGHMKVCSKTLTAATVQFSPKIEHSPQEITREIPVSQFFDCNINPPCGMASKDNILGLVDNPKYMFMPEREQAQLIWFNDGHITYRISNAGFPAKGCSELSISMEICSETVYHRANWPSDITISVNDCELLTYRSPGDFGGRRGKYSPEWWNINSTQFGLLKTFTVNKTGVYLDSQLMNHSFTIDDLNITNGNYFTLKLEIKEDAVHKGGINIFGTDFGDYPQAILVTVR